MDLNLGLNLALPELIIAVGALVILVFGAFRGDKGMTSVSALCGVVLIAAAYFAAFVEHGTAFSGSFVIDGVAAFAKVFIYISAVFVIVLGQGYFDRVGNRRFEFPILILLATLGMSMMVSAGDLIALYIGIELQSLALYVLAAFRRDDPKGSEAGLKYFVLGALSSGLLLYGASLVYGFTGSMNFNDIAVAAAANQQTGLIFGLVFLICGLAFKISAAPFHMWTPDVYEGAPTPVVAFAAGAPKFAALVLIARVLMGGFEDSIEQWRQVILAISVMSFIVGGLGGLMQKNIKRLMAYSSIANMGYALLAIAAGTEYGVQALLLFSVLYMVDTLGMFAVQMALSRKGQPVENVADLTGMSKISMPTTIVITILMLSLLGMPPLGGFWGKYYIFGSALAVEGLWPFAALGLAASVLSAFYYLRILKVMWFDAPTGELDKSPAEAKWIAYGAAAFAFPIAMLALHWLDPLAQMAASSFGLK
ncbi:NADH-quinone oxidoreductase subunit NuoN [Asticcacaulis sp. ZE23SCel15]|uniref:NADH-quinone oxidoreductase subunit NuoN n=1 Tax=Asticcacaulis sp. ZE23SCel15 TaxID=3059027 RepID=UPI00265E6D6B|nr:NADH-quinone oxidoreductase subunit NuoN [Asticcacaulis sp. ZE23SCel15]WKL56601.1 NADH-quinone oxidoreductase subunit NuoN [Asticcacaulis sp. ZE23SCel15]